jgi:UDP-N-acetylmuramyl pentapeptide synthase
MGFAKAEWDRADQVESLEGVREFIKELQPGDTVLIKGSRALELERALPEENS